MNISTGLLTWCAVHKQEKATALYLAARSVSGMEGGYFKARHRKKIKNLCGYSDKTFYRHLAAAIELGFIIKVKQGVYKIVAHHKVCVMLGISTSFRVEAKEYHLLFFKAFIQSAHGVMFVTWMNDLTLKQRRDASVGVKFRNQGQYALSLAAKYLGYSVSKACQLRKVSWDKRMSKVIRMYKTRLKTADKEFSVGLQRRMLEDESGYFLLEGYEEAFLIKLSRSRSLYSKIRSWGERTTDSLIYN